MKIIESKPLAPHTAFRIGGNARFFCSVSDRTDIEKAVHFAREKKLPIFVLGGGSNILVSAKGFDGLVMKMEIKGIEEVESPESRADGAEEKERSKEGKRKDSDDILIRAGAGEDWDSFVAWTIIKGYGGLENLSFIPGQVGAAPVQNIGAYGAEVGDIVEGVEAFDTRDDVFKDLSQKECEFSYRDSVFKREKDRYIIVSVLFKLKKDTEPDISYKDIKEYFTKNDQGSTIDWSKKKPSIAEVRRAVVDIRTAKLPDVRKVGTAGSFFKNPILSKEAYAELKVGYPELPGFEETDGRIKVPLAWIIDKVCDLKGKKYGKAGIHDTQALVIVNYGDAVFEDVEKVALEIERSVKEKMGIDIEREVVVI